MPDSIFVITLGDAIGLSIFALCILFVVLGAIFLTIREKLCKHNFQETNISRSAHWRIGGYRCTKCKKEVMKKPEGDADGSV